MIILRVLWLRALLFWWRRAQAGLSSRPSHPDYPYVCLRVADIERQIRRFLDHGRI